VAEVVDQAESHLTAIIAFDGQRGLIRRQLEQPPPGAVVGQDAVEVGEVEDAARVLGDIPRLGPAFMVLGTVHADQRDAAFRGGSEHGRAARHNQREREREGTATGFR
jgi:hypothetical protein